MPEHPESPFAPHDLSPENVRRVINSLLEGDPAKFGPADVLLAWLAQRELERMNQRPPGPMPCTGDAHLGQCSHDFQIVERKSKASHDFQCRLCGEFRPPMTAKLLPVPTGAEG